MTSNSRRPDALRDLVEPGTPVAVAMASLTAFPWPGEDPVVTLTVHDVRRVLDSFDARALSEAALVVWAEEVHGREDIELHPADRDLLADALFELSTPELFGPLPEIVSEIRTRLT